VFVMCQFHPMGLPLCEIAALYFIWVWGAIGLFGDRWESYKRQIASVYS